MPPTLKQRIASFAQRLFGADVPGAAPPPVSAPPEVPPKEGDLVPADRPPRSDPDPDPAPRRKARPRRAAKITTGTPQGPAGPRVVPRSEHNISRANISPNALKVLYRLRQAGYQAHLVGGGVRDLLLGREPKDFDVATDAEPEEVRGVFRNCRLIGRRFRLAHVHFGPEIIEVATFRGLNPDVAEADRRVENGLIVRDNAYGTIEEDQILAEDERRDSGA